MKQLRTHIKAFRRSVKNCILMPFRLIHNIWFFYSRRHIRNVRKIFYAITPPPRWKDIGDHAQVVAVQTWINRHYPGIPVIEMDKDRARYFLPALKRLVRPCDLILLHSGGNLGDRGSWSEGIRRLLIQTFRNNKVVSLPQTIYFSDTPKGRMERETTRRIYNEHPDLTVIARDPKSGETASDMFPRARLFCIPDFVLSLKPSLRDVRNNPPRVLLVIRKDNESFFTPERRKTIEDSLPYPFTRFDTVYAAPIFERERMTVLERYLDVFRSHDAVVTDRFHGLIFSVICRKPCVALRSVDHKLLSGRHWFMDVPFVRFTEDIGDILRFLDECLAVESREIPDYDRLYFDTLPELIGWR